MLPVRKNGQPSRAGVRTQAHLPREVIEQIDELSRVLHIPRASVISQAVSRMHGEEPLLRGNGLRKRK